MYKHLEIEQLLYGAVIRKEYRTVRDLLNNHNANVHYSDNICLKHATKNGDEIMAQLLLMHGADPRKQIIKGEI